jgi:hypothetical protein
MKFAALVGDKKQLASVCTVRRTVGEGVVETGGWSLTAVGTAAMP